MPRRLPSTSPPRTGRSLARLTIRAALVLGFGVTLALWLTTGYRITRQMRTLEAEVQAVTDRYMRAQSQLSDVRSHLLLGSVLVRDALLDLNPATARSYRARLAQDYDAADRALREYEPVLGHDDEQKQLLELRAEVDEFQQLAIEVLEASAAGTALDANAFVRDRIIPQREVAIRVSERVQTMNREAFVRQGIETSDLYQQTQRSAARWLGAALVLSLAIGLAAVVHSGRLERRLQRQRLRDQQLTRDLQRLSTRLVSAQEDERRTITRELHDEVGQALAAVKVELAMAADTCDAPDVVARLRRVRAIAEDALHRVRNLSHLLHPPMLDDLGLDAALEAYLRSVEARHGLAIAFTPEAVQRRLAPEIETVIYRVVQEAVTNVVNHARATRCRVSVEDLTGAVRVTIEDNGSGFDPDPSDVGRHAGGLGLIGIRERVGQFDGAFRIESGPGQGTRLTIELPALLRLPEPADEAEADPALRLRRAVGGA